MKRDIYQQLHAWKTSPRRKPLILKGARQVGKTYILKEFAEANYKSVAYLNFEDIPQLDSMFATRLDVNSLIKELSLLSGTKIEAEHTLIIFDEIQASNYALNALKFLYENANQYHIATAGSLLGLTLSKPKSFPVGKVDLLEMYPMTFLEFLQAVGKPEFRELIEERSDDEQGVKPFNPIFHQELITLLRHYFLVGGMPEAVQCFTENETLLQIRKIQNTILNAYALDFSKHASVSDVPKIHQIWNSLPSQLARENKKFLYSSIKDSARARAYESALQWLEDAGLIYRCTRISTPRMPLKSYCDISAFKIYVLDVGLLCAMSGLTPDILLGENKLFSEFKGSLTENYVAQQLKACKSAGLYYWASSGIAEVDFVLQGERDILPLEVKAGSNIRSKSLLSYDNKYNPTALSRTSLLNIKQDGKMYNYPLYAVSLFGELASDY